MNCCYWIDIGTVSQIIYCKLLWSIYCQEKKKSLSLPFLSLSAFFISGNDIQSFHDLVLQNDIVFFFFISSYRHLRFSDEAVFIDMLLSKLFSSVGLCNNTRRKRDMYHIKGATIGRRIEKGHWKGTLIN